MYKDFFLKYPGRVISDEIPSLFISARLKEMQWLCQLGSGSHQTECRKLGFALSLLSFNCIRLCIFKWNTTFSYLEKCELTLHSSCFFTFYTDNISLVQSVPLWAHVFLQFLLILLNTMMKNVIVYNPDGTARLKKKTCVNCTLRLITPQDLYALLLNLIT